MHTHTCPDCKHKWSHSSDWDTDAEFRLMHTCAKCGKTGVTIKDNEDGTVPDVKDLDKLEAQGRQSLRTIVRAWSLCWAMGEMIKQGNQKIARKTIRGMWKQFLNDKEMDQDHRDALGIIIDQFFDHDGDMTAAANEIKEMLKEDCPSKQWDRFFIEMEQQGARALALLSRKLEKAVA